MRYVLDTSVAFKWVVAEPDADKAIRLREDFRNGIHELLAPDIFPAEMANQSPVLDLLDDQLKQVFGHDALTHVAPYHKREMPYWSKMASALSSGRPATSA
jgi:hypothetical protein